MICIKCKKEIPDGSAFCNWCGKKQIVSPHAPKKRGNGEGTVFKKPCGTWRVEYVERYVLVDGKKKRITKTKSGFKTKKEALEYLAQIKTAKVKSETKKIYELYDIIYERELKELSKDKQSHYRTAFNRISDIASMNISELALEDLQAVVDSIDSGFYPKRDVKNLLNKIYEYAMISDYCTKNLAQYIKLPKNEKGEKVIFTASDIDKLWNSWDSGIEIAGYLLIMIHSGIRTGELRNIMTDNIDIDEQVMYGGIKTEKGKRRPIIIIDKTKPVVSYFMQKGTPKLCELSEYMFYKEWNRLKAELNLREELFPNCSRHTCATALAEANVPPAIIMDILGHEKYDTSLNYTHINIKSLKESLEKSL